MLTKSRGLSRRPLWVIQSYQNNRMDVFTIDPHDDGGFLAVFSFKEEAEAFLSLLEDDHKSDWHSRETSSGELVSVLLGPCAEVRRVALDPLPLSCAGGVSLPLVSVNRERFLQDLMGDFRGLVGEFVFAKRVGCLYSPNCR
jgi:hypothetical protein